MRGTRRMDGALTPLFDRLIDEAPGVPSEPVPKRVLDVDGVRDSVEREIHILLNTRCPLGESVVDYETRSVIDYGLVDLTHYFTGNPNDRKRIARHVAKTIAVYEPRLTRINVVVETVKRETGTLELRVDGGLRVGTHIEPVSFPVRVEGADTVSEG